MSDNLDNTLNNLKSVIKSKSPKVSGIIEKWIKDWTMYLKWEETFDPKRLIYYKRGDIVYLNFGFNIGSEYGGIHYAVVVENNNNNSNPNVVVVPLTSLDEEESIDDLHHSEIYLGKDLIPWKPGETVAKPAQITSISKIRIIKPKKAEDEKTSLSGDLLDKIDKKVIELFTKSK